MYFFTSILIILLNILFTAFRIYYDRYKEYHKKWLDDENVIFDLVSLLSEHNISFDLTELYLKNNINLKNIRK